MSTSSLPQPFLVPSSSSHKGVLPRCAGRVEGTPVMVRRRASMQQGKGLEVLGHAIEYLVDSRMFLVGDPRMVVEADAVRVLSRCSRALFLSCAVVEPVGTRLRTWMAGRPSTHGVQLLVPRG